MRYIIDSYAWLEYFMGTAPGRRVKEIIDSEADEKLTPSICLAETYAKILKTEDEEKAELRRSFIKSRSALVLLTEELAVEAAKVDVSMKRRVQGWGLADSIVLSTARNRNGKVVTGDLHFRGLTEAHMI
jgi:predicted nucleic acid-binding protein